MEEIFISYKSERRRAAEHLAEVLRRHGYSVWFDYHLIKGEDFDFQLDAKLVAAKAVVVLWCSQSVESKWDAARSPCRVRQCRQHPQGLGHERLVTPGRKHPDELLPQP